MLHDLIPGFVPDRRGLVTVPTDTVGTQKKARVVARFFQKLISYWQADALPVVVVNEQ